MREASKSKDNNNYNNNNNSTFNNSNNENTNDKTTTSTSMESGEKRRVVKVNLRELNDLAVKYSSLIAESFFLQNVRGTYADFESYLRKAHSALLSFLKSKSLDPEDPNLLLRALYNGRVPQNSPFKPTPVLRDKNKGGGTSSAIPGLLSGTTSTTTISNHQSAGASLSSYHHVITSNNSSSSSSSSNTTTTICSLSNHISNVAGPATTTTIPSGSSQLHQQQIHFHKPPDVIQPGRKYSLKAEASVVQRISELQKEGMWYDRRLPKNHEPSRIKAHWDYLLEEMTWLAADFASERKWKRIASKRCARMIDKYFNDREIERARAEKQEEARLRRIASFIAKEIQNFWSNAQQIVEYKEQSRIEEMKKQALDQQLSYIVDQTEKYSSMLAESFVGDTGMNTTLDTTHDSADGDTTDMKTEVPSDEEFEPAQESEEDDEETIAKEEEEHEEGDNELHDLERCGQMSLDDLLDDLPPEYLEELASKLPKSEESITTPAADSDLAPSAPVPSSSSSEETKAEIPSSASQVDAESPTKESEHATKTVSSEVSADTPKVLDEALDAVMDTEPAESGSEFESEMDESDSETAEDEGSSGTEESDIVTEEEEEQEDEEQTVGLASLLQTFAPERAGEDHEDDALNSVAAMAESFQPKGYTLSSQKVNTKAPALLHHELREYQLIGLDWMVTMHEKKLNGILADEMGLGKTIQTIALLAHLACEKGIWGPHLIVVPTSVMLNWEMEFKKWCPGFKILTYYGSIKERRLKRTGWTKPNAFHVCITSYKLVIQDHASFRRKRWKYLILDEAQNIKNFKSQRWQLLLNFSTNRRLLLTGTPLQNNLMELWSLMHFLMPNVFQSHREFREWFSNPVSGMVEGNSEYNENIIRRLHKVLRPFILRRLKSEVEKQLPKKHEHVVMCRLSKRQRFLYEDFMSRTKTKETLATGNLLSVINVLMQLRKVCNHPNLFESRPVISPLQSDGITYLIPSIVYNLQGEKPYENPTFAIFSMATAEVSFTKHQASRILELKPPSCSEEASSPKDSFILDDSLDNSLKRRLAAEEEDMTEYDLIVQTSVVDELSDGSIRCAPKRRKFLKWCADVALPAPKTKYPIPFFLMNVDPMPYLEDNEFVETVGAGASKNSSLKIVNQMEEEEDVVDDEDNLMPVDNLAGAGSSISSDTAIVEPQIVMNHQDIRLRPVLLDDGVKRDEMESSIEGRSFSEDDEDKTDDQGEDEAGGEGDEIYEQEDESGLSEGFSDADDDEGPSRKRRKKAAGISKRDVKRPRRESPRTEEDEEDEEEEEDEYDEEETTAQENSAAEEDFDSTDVDETSSEDFNLDTRSKYLGDGRSSCGAQWVEAMGLNPVEFQEADVQARSLRSRRALIERLKFVNERRCELFPVIGFDAVDQCRILGQLPIMRYYGTRCRHLKIPYRRRSVKRDYENNGYFLQGWSDVCMGKLVKNSPESSIRNHPLVIWQFTKALMSMIWTLDDVLEDLSPVLKRFIIYVPAVSSPVLSLRVFHPSPSLFAQQFNIEEELREVLSEPAAVLHPIISSTCTQFPDPRLIQYDCGKLQVLDVLLRRLKTEGHRALIFTQMAKMLDVLEAFLNYHGHIYLRLDGATRIDQRQILMEKFNSDKRIFCFILSTRSGGIGINLTGADTVIFYDSDWNPTMDAQAQDRCHRIGQTRDVHIYRLVSEKTIEENILKKSNQKRLLGELAIEGGNFTTAYFRKTSIYELFDVQSNENDVRKRLMDQTEEAAAEADEIKQVEVEEEPSLSEMPDVDKNKMQMFENALAAAEDETDVQATRTVKAEAAAELAEFDESIPLEDLGDGQEIVEKSMVDAEMDSIMAELSKVEIYALRFMERTIDDWSRETVAQAQKELEQQKREWELEQIRQLEARNKLSPDLSDEEDMITYSASDAQNQVWISQGGGEQFMPLWAPPTPPSDDTDVYVDYCHGFLYDYGLIPESSLPPVYQPPKKDKKPTMVALPTTKQTAVANAAPVTPPDDETALTPLTTVEKKSPKVPRRDEPIFAPRSLFDRPTPQMAKLRRDYRLQKYNCRPVGTAAMAKSTLGPGAITFPIVHPTTTKAPSPPPQHESVEWMIAEDHALLQTIQNILEMPLSLLVVNLAQTPNWDLAAEMVNLTSKIYRTPKQCKIRYETIVGPREEGKLFYEQPPAAKKQKKSKSFIKVGPPSPSRAGRIVKMSQLISADNNSQLLNTYTAKFDVIKNIQMKRPMTKPMTLNPHMKTNKQAATIFNEHGINLENPISATAIAQTRYERLQLERKKLYAAQQAAVAAGSIQQQQQHAAVTTAALNAAAALKAEGSRVAAAAVASGATSPTVSVANVASPTLVATVPTISLASGTGVVTTTTNVIATASEVHKQKIAAAAAAAQGSDVPVLRFAHPTSATALQDLISRRATVGTAATSNPILAKRQYAVSQQQNQLQQQLQILQQHQLSQKHPKISLQLAQVAHKPAQGQTVQPSVGGVQQIAVSSPQVVISQSSAGLTKTQVTQALTSNVQIQGQKQVVMTSTGQVVTQQAGQSQVLGQPIQLQQKQVVMAYQQAVQQKHQQQQQQQIQIQLSQAPSIQTGTVHQAGGTTQTVQVSAPSVVISQSPSQLTSASQLAQSIHIQGQKQVVMTSSGQAQLVQQQSQQPVQQQQVQAQQQQQQSTIQIQGQKQVVMAYPTNSQAQMGQKAQLVQAQPGAQQQQQQPQQVQVHLHPQSSQAQGVTMGHGTQTVVLPAGLAEALSSVVAPSGSLTSGQLTNLIATSTPVSVVSSSMASSGVMTASTAAGTLAARTQTLGQQLGQHAGQQGQRTVTMQLVKQHTVGGKTVTRTVSDAEVAAFLKQHGLTPANARVAIASQPGTQAQIGQLTGAKGSQQVTQVQVPAAQIITSVGLQKYGYQISSSGTGAQVATVLKAPAANQAAGGQSTSVAFPVSFSQVKGVAQKAGTLGKQTPQMNALQQQLLTQQRRQTQQLQQQQQQAQQQTASKLAHLAQVSSPQGGVPQLIVQTTPNQIQKTINVQHIQHVLKPGQVIQGQSGVLQAQLLTQKGGLSRVTTSNVQVGVPNVAVSGVSQPTMVAVSSHSGGLPTTVTIPTGLVATTPGAPGIIRISQQNQSLKPGSIQMLTAQTASLLNQQQQQQTLARPYLSGGQTISAVNVSSGTLGGQPVSVRLQGSTGTIVSSTSNMPASSPTTTLAVASVSSITTAAPSLVVTSDSLSSPGQGNEGTTVILMEDETPTVVSQSHATLQQQQQQLVTTTMTPPAPAAPAAGPTVAITHPTQDTS